MIQNFMKRWNRNLMLNSLTLSLLQHLQYLHKSHQTYPSFNCECMKVILSRLFNSKLIGFLRLVRLCQKGSIMVSLIKRFKHFDF